MQFCHGKWHVGIGTVGIELVGIMLVGIVPVGIAPVGIGTCIDLKVLGAGGQLPKCLKFCPGIEVYGRFSLKNERL